MFFYWSPLQTGKTSGVLPHNRLHGNQLQALTGFLCIADGLPDVPPSVNQEAGWTCGDLSLYASCSDVFENPDGEYVPKEEKTPGCFQKYGCLPPKSFIHFNRVFPYFHHPILGVKSPYFWKHPPGSNNSQYFQQLLPHRCAPIMILSRTRVAPGHEHA